MPKMKVAIIILLMMTVIGVVGIYYWRSKPVDFDLPQTGTDNIVGVTSKEVCARQLGIEDPEAPPKGRQWFLGPDCSFGFQYIGGDRSYRIEKVTKDTFAITDGLSFFPVEVQITPLVLNTEGIPTYDYGRLATDQSLSPTLFLEEIEWNGYPGYKTVFSYNQYPERYLYIHIPHKDKLFTLHRGTRDDDISFEQFLTISETFILPKE